MVRFPEATKRIFGNVYVCRKCKTKRKADPAKVLKGKISCKKCASKALRPIKKSK
ncbi:MAG: 50S ribosomal protein L40e [Candidatus Nanoarchaeia archaeon]